MHSFIYQEGVNTTKGGDPYFWPRRVAMVLIAWAVIITLLVLFPFG